MKYLVRIFVGIAVFAAVGSFRAEARALSFEEKSADLEQLVSLMRSGYGPLQYKKETLGIDLAELRALYLEKARATRTNGEFYRLIEKFVAEYKDSHFMATLPTTHASSLPFSTDLVGGKVLIDAVDRSRLPREKFPFEVGDEVVTMNGRLVAEVVAEINSHRGLGYELTGRRWSTFLVTSRPGSIVPVATGETRVAIRRGTSANVDEVVLQWQETGEPLDERLTPTSPLALDGLAAEPRRAARDFDELSVADLWREAEHPDVGRSFRCSGSTRVDIPKDATVIMMSPFVAYFHPTPKGNVGYLRIPHYAPVNERTGEREHELRFAQYEYAVAALEAATVGLVIDQDHNCGGSVVFLEKMVGLFMHKPYAPMQFELLANKQEYLDFKGWLDETDPHTLDYLSLKSTLDTLKASWLEGRAMTPRLGLTGARELVPNSVRYTKPIVMLIDEMSGSGGDAFPSLMKGYGRAKLLGTRTMGAGGHVVEQPPLFYSRVSLRMTKSLFFRPDGVAVENNGAEPDYKYSHTREDLMYGYRDYQRFYVATLLDLLE